MPKTKMNNTLNCCNHTWTQFSNMDADWITEFDRFVCSTWKFGNIHQCKIFVRYYPTKNGKKINTTQYTIGDSYVAICRQGYKIRKQAMEKAIEWCKNYQKKGTDTVESSIKYSMKHFSNLYPNRIALMDHYFFAIGNGYDWLDGALINTNPDSHIEYKKQERAHQKMTKNMQRIQTNADKLLKKYHLKKAPTEEHDALDKAREAMWNADVYQFYPVSEEYSNICRIPDDVRPDWLRLVYESALLLKDRKLIARSKNDENRQKQNREMGVKIVAELENRFPQLKQ